MLLWPNMKFKSQLPSRVPLPEVSQHTDRIEFESLGLPEGFAEDRLTVNLRALALAQTLAGLGSITVRTEEERHYPEIDGRLGSLAGSIVYFPTNETRLDNPEVLVKINQTGVHQRIEAEHRPKGLLEPRAQAKYLNRALVQGLSQASSSANFDWRKGAGTMLSGALEGTAFALGAASPAVCVGIYEFFAVASPLFRMTQLAHDDPNENMRDLIKRYRWSAVLGVAPDRYLLGQAALTRRIISAADDESL